MKLVDKLREEVLVVTFRKKDGTLRDMKCTLMEDFLPETKGSGSYTGITTVYDVEKEGWRSFRTDSVVEIADLVGNPLVFED